MIVSPTRDAEPKYDLISAPVTWAEICARYPGEWVCLVEMDRVHPFGFEERAVHVAARVQDRDAA